MSSARRERPPVEDQLLEVRPADELHREEEAVLGLARLVHGDDRRVLERRLQHRLAPEAAANASSSPRCDASTFSATVRPSESCVAS